MIVDVTLLGEPKSWTFGAEDRSSTRNPIIKRKRVMGNQNKIKKQLQKTGSGFSLDAEVMTNKTLIYASRSMIEENRLMILSNYSAAFMGNRQIANNDTDEIFENRHAILDNVDTHGDVEENFVSSQKNKAHWIFYSTVLS